MADWILIVGGASIIVGACLMHRPRKTIAGDMDTPMDLDRGRAKSEAKATAPVTEADQVAAAPLVAFVAEIGTDELPIVRPPVRRHHTMRRPSRRQARAARLLAARSFAASPLVAMVPDPRRLAGAAEFEAQKLRWFAPAIEASARLIPDPPAEPKPDPWFLESFTQGWTKADVERMVAEAKAGAR